MLSLKQKTVNIMQYITKLKLAAVHQLCDAEDKSTEFTIAIMMDLCKVDMDCVVSYLSLPQSEHQKLWKEVIDFCELFDTIDKHPHLN